MIMKIQVKWKDQMRKAPAGIAELARGRRTQYITVSSSQQSPYNTQNGLFKKTIFLQIFYSFLDCLARINQQSVVPVSTLVPGKRIFMYKIFSIIRKYLVSPIFWNIIFSSSISRALTAGRPRSVNICAISCRFALCLQERNNVGWILQYYILIIGCCYTYK